MRRRATRAAWLAGELPIVAEWRAGRARAAPAPPVERDAQALESWLAQWIAAELDVPVATVDPTAALAALGLDSLRTLRLAHVVQRDLGADVPLARLYDGANLRQLALDLSRAPDASWPARAKRRPGRLLSPTGNARSGSCSAWHRRAPPTTSWSPRACTRGWTRAPSSTPSRPSCAATTRCAR